METYHIEVNQVEKCGNAVTSSKDTHQSIMHPHASTVDHPFTPQSQPEHHNQLENSLNPNTACAQAHIIIVNSGHKILPDKSIQNNNFASI